MALMINDDCVVCGACLDECPNEGISEGDPYKIDPDVCTECVGYFNEPQCVNICPVEAIVPDPDHVEAYEELLEKSKKIHVD